MKIGPIIHQQIVQLKWHFLACLGLIMVLPLEEAVVNWRDGAGFYAAGMAEASVFLSPLLAGLIACANVQADLDDRRYTFWRSKPVGTASFMTLKFAVGLILALVIFACPVMFGLIGDKMYPRAFDRVGAAAPIYWNFLLITVMAYSFCFLCNVLMRKTAQAWLIGIAVSCFLLVVPFILPLNLKEIGDFSAVLSRRPELLLLPVILFLIVAVPALSAFILSLIAAARNWHLRTNLKGLLWAGSALLFLLMMLFTRQIANIKVLDEIKLESGRGRSWDAFFYRIDDRLYFHGRQEIQTSDGRIKVIETADWFKTEMSWTVNNHNRPDHSEQKLELTTYPWLHSVYRRISGQLYAFSLHIYSKREKVEYAPDQFRDSVSYQHAFLRSFMVLDDELFPVSTLDVSECLTSEADSFNRFALRLIDDKLIAFVGNQRLTAAVKDSGEIELLGREPQMRYRILMTDRDRIIQIPLIKTDTIGIKERIRFVIDFTYKPFSVAGDSIVDIHNDKISFYLVSDRDIARYEVVRWDDDYVYCKFQSARPFTFLEQSLGRLGDYDRFFVRNGKLYAHGAQKLMVFDIRTERTRKIGHWERLDDNFGITDVGVLEDGNIVMAVGTRSRQYSDGRLTTAFTLYLLKNPE